MQGSPRSKEGEGGGDEKIDQVPYRLVLCVPPRLLQNDTYNDHSGAFTCVTRHR